MPKPKPVKCPDCNGRRFLPSEPRPGFAFFWPFVECGDGHRWLVLPSLSRQTRYDIMRVEGRPGSPKGQAYPVPNDCDFQPLYRLENAAALTRQP